MIHRKHLYLFLIFLFSLSGCKKEEVQENPTCGCDSEELDYIENISGKIYYKNYKYVSDYLRYNFWIQVTYDFCSNCLDFLIVCNPEGLNGEFDYLFNNNPEEYVQVSFSGSLKEVCEPTAGFAEDRYFRLEIESISRVSNSQDL